MPREKTMGQARPVKERGANRHCGLLHHAAAVSKPGKAPRLGLATASTLKSRAMLAPNWNRAIARQAQEGGVDGRTLALVGMPPQRRGALLYAETGKPFALRHGAMNSGACGPRGAGEGAKIDMRGEIGFARIAQGIGEAMPLHRLQGFAARRRVVAIVDDEEHAALRRNAPGKLRHHTEPRQTRLQHLTHLLARFAWRGQAGFRVWREPEAQMPFAIEADQPLMPAILAADEMAHRQTIEKFIGENDRGASR